MTPRFVTKALFTVAIYAFSHRAALASMVSYADEDWFPIDKSHYIAVAASPEADMVLHMRPHVPATPELSIEIALRHDEHCRTLTDTTNAADWLAGETLELNGNVLPAETRCEDHALLYRPHSDIDRLRLQTAILSDQPITISAGAQRNVRFDNVNGREAWEGLQPCSYNHLDQPLDSPNTRPSDEDGVSALTSS